MDDAKDEEFLEDSRIPSSKRMLSTEDPDYTRPPDPKRMKEMEERAQDELRERVIKVVDGVLSNAINEKQNEIEEADARILRIQQCLHTLRYCVSLNYHAASKLVSTVGTSKQSYEVHPTVRKHMGKAPVSSASSSSSRRSFDAAKDNDPQCERLQNKDNDNTKGNITIKEESPMNSSGCERLGFGGCSEAESQGSKKNVNDTVESTGKNLESSRPPSPKYLPPKPPDTQTIAQGRRQRFQSKRRIVVGNTYQYLTPQVGREVEDAMRYKWQMYVRAPPQENDIASFVSNVTFLLDRSYAPHHIITLSEPPFVLSRRGWGEFKVQIVLKFRDGRNKQVQLLHPLVLSRPDDPLALTGLWRLGQENWYDVWVYEGSTVEPSKAAVKERILEEDETTATLEKELHSGVVSAQVERNVTVSHNSQENPAVKLETNTRVLQKPVGLTSKGDKVANSSNSNSNPSGVNKPNAHIKVTVSDNIGANKNDSQVKVSNGVGGDKCNSVPQKSGVNDCAIKSKNLEVDSNVITVKGGAPSSSSSSKTTVSNGAQSKMCKIHVRQPDGRLVPYFIPAHMYSLALKIAQMRSNKNASETDKTAVSKDSNDALKSASTEISVSQLQGDSSGVSKKTNSNLSLAIEKGTSKQQEEMATVGSIKIEALNSTSLLNKTAVATSDVTSPSSGTVTEIKMPIKPKEGNVTKNQGIPVKILNLSPSKNAIKPSQVMSSVASTSGIQKLAFTTQGKQTLVRSGTLTQSALLQLLSKVGVKDRNAVVQQLLSKTGLKEGAVDLASLQKVQGQLICSQGTKSNIHLMPVKIVQDKLKNKQQERQMLATTSVARAGQQPICPKNIKFVTNNGQLISTGSLTKGMMINTSVRSNAVIKPVTVNNSVLTVATSSVKGTSASKGKERPNVFMMPDGRILTGSSAGLQVVTTQGKNVMPQVNPLIISSSLEKGKVHLQMPPLVVRGLNCNNVGVLQTVTTATTTTTTITTSALTGVTVLSGGGLDTPGVPSVRPLSKPRIANTTTTTTTGITTVAPSLITNVVGKITSILPGKKSAALNATIPEKLCLLTKVMDDVVKEQELSVQQKWEERTRELVSICKHCNSVEACVSVWVRALPLVSDSVADATRTLFPYRAASWERFLQWPLGKQRAAEFQRGREVKHWLSKCAVDGVEQWTVCRIVGWARRYAHTPLPYRHILHTDNMLVSDVRNRCETSLTCFDSMDKIIEESGGHLFLSREAGPQEIDVDTISDVPEKNLQKLPASPMKNAMEFVPWDDHDVVGGCEWVGRRTSELRINFPTEEVLPGFVADAGRAIAWQAVLTFMEDLLRSSYSQTWEEKTAAPVTVPPKVITFDHVKDALINTRPEFDLFTCEGLGAIAEDMEPT